MDVRNTAHHFSTTPVLQFLPSLRLILDEAKQLIRDWILFVNPFPEPKGLILESLAVIQLSRQATGLKGLTSLNVNDREYLSFLD